MWGNCRRCGSRTNTSASPIGLKSRHGILRPFRSRGFIRSFRIPEGELSAATLEPYAHGAPVAPFVSPEIARVRAMCALCVARIDAKTSAR